jgi:hypothetical protein
MYRRLQFLLGPRFFGLKPEDKEALILEPIFALTYHCHMDYVAVYNMPVMYKRWFMERLVKQKQDEAKAAEGKSSSETKMTPNDPRVNSFFNKGSPPNSSTSK